MNTRVVEAASVADYIARYYKTDRRLDHDRAYGEGSLTRAYEAEYERDGYVCTSRHDNVTGEFIYWPCRPEQVAEQRDALKRAVKDGRDKLLPPGVPGDGVSQLVGAFSRRGGRR